MSPAAAAAGNDGGNVQISDREKDKDYERDREKGSKNKQSSKVKDLSHVPCKFFKVGACTAGSSCPFSHTLQEPGSHKEVCAWYIKGNCKFAHKCALAHVLPGQSMAMDRKNKKAAQVAAGNPGGGKDAGKGVRAQKKDVKPLVGLVGSPSTLTSHPRNPLLSGSTAPTRILPPSSRLPLTMPLKATISPSAPAPPLNDTDFASFELSDNLSTPPRHGKSPSQLEPTRTTSDTPKMEVVGASEENQSSPASSPLPMSTHCAPRRLGVALPGSSGSLDFGPIGSPPRSIGSAGQQAGINGFSPGTSPSRNAGFASSSPFSAPGTQTVFLSYENDATDFKARSGIAASLGANRTWMTDFPVSSQTATRTNFDLKMIGGDVVVEDEDLEDFLPSSLTDLLTVEERSRRMSRSNSGQSGVTVIRDLSAQRSNVDGPHHRYSRSVPAPSLLSEIKSIWADSSSGLPASPEASTAGPTFAGRLSSGTPSSYKSNTGFGGRSFNEDTQSPSIVPPSNASAAFLPGLHHHYLNSKTGSQHPSSGRSTSSTNAGGVTHTSFSANPFVTAGGMAISPPQIKSFGNRPPFEAAAPDSDATHLSAPGRPIPGNAGFGDADDGRNALSPSARALQAHAPGQSLPQGLAAGYSRIHALPPPAAPSPSVSAFSPGKNSTFSPSVNGYDWASTSDIASGLPGIGVTSPNSGLESMFSRLSYSTAVSRAPNNSSNSSSIISSAIHSQAPSTMAPGIVRNVSGRSWQNHGPFSPLSGPVLTGDDDDLFSMDG